MLFTILKIFVCLYFYERISSIILTSSHILLFLYTEVVGKEFSIFYTSSKMISRISNTPVKIVIFMSKHWFSRFSTLFTDIKYVFELKILHSGFVSRMKICLAHPPSQQKNFTWTNWPIAIWCRTETIVWIPRNGRLIIFFFYIVYSIKRGIRVNHNFGLAQYLARHR